MSDPLAVFAASLALAAAAFMTVLLLDVSNEARGTRLLAWFGAKEKLAA
jgi:hypothetical protein